MIFLATQKVDRHACCGRRVTFYGCVLCIVIGVRRTVAPLRSTEYCSSFQRCNDRTVQELDLNHDPLYRGFRSGTEISVYSRVEYRTAANNPRMTIFLASKRDIDCHRSTCQRTANMEVHKSRPSHFVFKNPTIRSLRITLFRSADRTCCEEVATTVSFGCFLVAPF
jgi:hypothetical protein